MSSTSYTVDDKRAFAAWLSTPAAVRKRTGMPTSKAAYARRHGVTDRTLRRWEAPDDKVFARLLAEAHEAWQSKTEDAPEAEVVPDVPDVEGDALKRDYEAVRASIVSRAREGDPKAMDAFMKYYGKTLAEEEAAARNSGLSALSDDELVAETLSLIGRDRVEQWLAT